MKFSDLLHPPGDKVSLGEMALIKSKLPSRITAAIPACMYTEDGRFDYEVVILLAWVIARRENKDITLEEVGDLIGLKAEENLDQIEKEILYFYSRRTREDIDEHFKRVQEAAKKAEEIAEGLADEAESSVEVEKTVNPPEDPGNATKI